MARGLQNTKRPENVSRAAKDLAVGDLARQSNRNDEKDNMVTILFAAKEALGGETGVMCLGEASARISDAGVDGTNVSGRIPAAFNAQS